MRKLPSLKIFFVLFSLSLLSLSETSLAEENHGVDLNDVSLLFPEPQTKQDLGEMLRADSELRNGQKILPAEILKDVFRPVVLRKDEQISNVALLDEAGRVSQHLVLQPISDLRSSGFAADVTLFEGHRLHGALCMKVSS